MNLFPGEHETIEGVSRLIRERQRTCVQVTSDCLARIDELEPRIKAWVHVDRAGALARAAELDDQLESCLKGGRDPLPLHGIPFGIKDIIDVAGMPTAAGAKRWADGPAKTDAAIVAALRKAGAVILGKTVTTAYAWIDPPPTRNPWNTERTPGGSSSGSAAAVAAGMCLGAVGTQTGGSLTRPSAFCGVASFKPADGTGLTAGVVPLARSLDTPGFMARTVGDLRRIWDAVCLRLDPPAPERHWPPIDPLVYPRTQPPAFGRLRGFFQDLAEPAMRVVLESALVDLEAAGATVIESELPEAFGGVHRPHRVVMAAEAAAFHSERIRKIPDDYPPRIRALVEEGLAIPSVDYIHAQEIRGELVEAVQQAMTKVHALAVPAALGPAPDVSTTGDPSFNSPWTFTRSPTVSFPLGLSGDGLPLGIQLVGSRRNPGSLLDLAAWAEGVIRKRAT
jgi:aspartyl-tRNA(Asn)/glutamyl-tRNA(Gln) amidotransferase subunit A